jgi:hypothetical protein
MNSYFDGSDYNNEIKYYVDDKQYWYLDYAESKLIDAYIKENNAILNDGKVTHLFNSPQNLTFY